jgi:hypothetical protein
MELEIREGEVAVHLNKEKTITLWMPLPPPEPAIEG